MTQTYRIAGETLELIDQPELRALFTDQEADLYRQISEVVQERRDESAGAALAALIRLGQLRRWITDHTPDGAEPRPLVALRADARAILEASIASVVNTTHPAFPELEALRHAAEVWRLLDVGVRHAEADVAAIAAATQEPSGDELAGRVWEYIANAPGLDDASNLADQAVALIAQAGIARGETG